MEWIAIGALTASLGSLIVTAMAMRYNARKGFVETLEQRVTRLEKEVVNCEADRDRLTRDNVRLLKELVRIGGPKDYGDDGR